MGPTDNRSDLRLALASCKPFFQRAVFFGIFINLLALAPTG